jgi:hypothetical protein
MTKQTMERGVLIAAGAVIVVLTAGAFWLSYAHLAEVAGQHGLAASPIRQWAWPATLDLFIVGGDLLMFRAAGTVGRSPRRRPGRSARSCSTSPGSAGDGPLSPCSTT